MKRAIVFTMLVGIPVVTGVTALSTFWMMSPVIQNAVAPPPPPRAPAPFAVTPTQAPVAPTLPVQTLAAAPPTPQPTPTPALGQPMLDPKPMLDPTPMDPTPAGNAPAAPQSQPQAQTGRGLAGGPVVQ